MGEESTIEIACADVDAFATAYRLITKSSPAYRALVRRAQTATDDETPAGFCARLLDDLERLLGGREEAVWGRFVTWAGEQPTVPGLFWLLAAEVAAAHGDWPGTLELATAALSADQTDRRAQDLFRQARSSVETTHAVVSENQADYFCSRPFEDFQPAANGKTYFCCQSWLPIPIGDYRTETPEAIWNSPTAQEIRRSILDGDYPLLQQDPLLVPGQPLPTQTWRGDRPTSPSDPRPAAHGASLAPKASASVARSQLQLELPVMPQGDPGRR